MPVLPRYISVTERTREFHHLCGGYDYVRHVRYRCPGDRAKNPCESRRAVGESIGKRNGTISAGCCCLGDLCCFREETSCFGSLPPGGDTRGHGQSMSGRLVGSAGFAYNLNNWAGFLHPCAFLFVLSL